MTTRPVQPSLIEGYPDRPVGHIPPSVMGGTNAVLIAAVADLYLTGSVMDVTYGRGGWWQKFTPDPFTKHDLYTLDGVDFRALPEEDSSMDTVCFDPPYVPQGGMQSSTNSDFRERFGLQQESQRIWECFGDMSAGLAECARVSRELVLAKCSDFVTGGKFTLGSLHMMNEGERLGLSIHDVIVHHTGSGPGGHNIFDIKRARRHHSYLIVFRKAGA